MLKKLIKYEWKATKRIFFPLYGAMLLAALVNGVFLRFDDVMKNDLTNGIKGLMVFAYVAIIIATFVMTAVVMIQRYYKNVLGREGYLMNTLPVTGTELIWSKAIVATIWFVGSTFVVMISLPLIFFITSPETFQEFFGVFFSTELWNRITSDISNINFVFWALELLLFAIVSCFAGCMKVYAAMSMGHLVHKSRMIASVGFFIAFDFAEKMLMLIVSYIIAFVCNLGIGKWILEFLSKGNGIVGVHAAFLGTILCSLIITIIYFFLSKFILDKKLNLE